MRSVSPLACGKPSKWPSTEAWPQGHPGPCGSGDALEVLCPKVLKVKQIAYELAGTFSNHDAVWLCNALQPCGQVWRLAYDGLLLRSPGPDQIADDHKTRCDADTRLQGRVGLQIAYCTDQFQPCTHGPLGVVLVSLRIAEVDEDPVAHVLSVQRTAAKALDGLKATHFLIGRNDFLRMVFRVDASRRVSSSRARSENITVT